MFPHWPMVSTRRFAPGLPSDSRSRGRMKARSDRRPQSFSRFGSQAPVRIEESVLAFTHAGCSGAELGRLYRVLTRGPAASAQELINP